MGSEFLVFLRLGFEHITDVGGYDHLLFVAALTASDLGQWRRLFWLVTAFTVGHSATLALATLDLVRISPAVVEVMIPVTILATSLVNAGVWMRPGHAARSGEGGGASAASSSPGERDPERETPAEARTRYLIAVGFGLIHGLGFSNYLRSLLGSEGGLALPLFSFNVGIETGQIMIVVMIMLLTYLVVGMLRMPRREWDVLLSGAGLGISLVLMIDRFPF